MTTAHSGGRRTVSVVRHSGRALGSAFFDRLEPRQLLTAVFWDGGAGDNFWHSPDNWSTDAVPTAADDVSISLPASSPTIIFDANSEIRSVRSLVTDESMSISGGTLSILEASSFNADLTVSGGVLDVAGATVLSAGGTLSAGFITGSGDVTVTGQFNWTGGTLEGTGLLTIAPAGSLSLTGSVHSLGRDAIFNGPVSWNEGDLYFYDAVVTNNATFTANPSASISAYGIVGDNSFVNAGSFIKQGASDTGFLVSSVPVAFNNTGAVTISAGQLSMQSGGSHTGDFSLAPGTTLGVGGDHIFAAGSDITGNGNLFVASGTSTYGGSISTSGSATFVGGTFTITGAVTAGSVTVSGGTVAFNGTASTPAFTFSGGLITGAGDLTVTGALSWTGGTLEGTGQLTIAAAASLSLSGSIHSLGRDTVLNGPVTWTEGDIYFYGATLTNNATFTISANSALAAYGIAGDNTFINAGTLLKQGASDASFLISSVPVAFNNTGTVTVSAGQLLMNSGGIHSGDFSVATGTTLGVGGDHTFAPGSDIAGNGNLLVASGTSSYAGSISTSGSATFTGGTFTISGSFSSASVVVSGGIVAFNGPASTSALALSAGVVTGSGNLTVTGVFNWTGGTLDGTGQLIISPTGSASLTGTVHLLGRDTVFNGPVMWTEGDLYFYGATVTNNAAFTINPVASVTAYGIAGDNLFINAGTLTKHGASDTGFLISSVIVAFSNSGTVNVLNGDLTFNQPTFMNSGDISLVSGSQISITGGFVQTGTGSITTQIAGATAGTYGRIIATGPAAIDGDLTASVVGGFTPQRFDRFDIVTGSSLTGTFDNVVLPIAAAANRKWVIVYQPDRAQLLYTSTADWDNSGTIGSADITAFLSSWFSDLQNGTLTADFNNSGSTGSSDITAFLNAWFFALGGG
ncbi:MAG: hypothetical protein H7Y88_07445 [Phycisphaerales bacterium]|nr:hypothetical protein [Phycisphaerales bacterium]